MTEREYLISLSTFISIGPIRTKLLLAYFKSAKNIWNASQKDLAEVGLGEKLVEKFVEHRNKFDFENYSQKLKKESVVPITIFEKDYPENLKDLDDCPFVLYVKGTLKKSDSRAVAIVGTREAKPESLQLARDYATVFAQRGWTVVSGLLSEQE